MKTIIKVSEREGIVTTVYKVDNPKGKVRTVTINAPKDEKIFMANYAYGLHLVFSKKCPEVYKEALKIAETWVD